MTNSWNRLLALALLAGSATALTACGDDGDGGSGGPDSDVVEDTSDAGTDTDPTLDIGDDTEPDSGTCTTCDRPQDCGAGFTCTDGCCVPVQVDGPPWERPLDACTSASQSTPNFLCETTIGQCLQRCPTAETDETRGRNCPTGSFCVEDGTPGVEDPTTGRVIDGYCLPGDCSGSLFDDDACEGVISVLNPGSRCTSDDCTCQPFANGASFCFPAGTARVGDECGRPTGNTIPADQLCEAGLLCGGGRCELPCNLRDGAGACTDTPAAESCPEGGDCACLPVYDTTPRNQPGICAVSCEPFSVGSCPDDQQCLPRLGRFGINAWTCAENPAADLPGAGEECDQTLGEFAACQEGFICTRETETGPTLCLGYCDPALLGAGCGEEVVGPTLFGPAEFEDATDFSALAAGMVSVTVRDAGTNDALAAIDVTVTEDEYTTYLALADATEGAQFSSFSDEAELATDAEEGVRFFHGSPDAGDVDIYLGGWIEGLAYGDAPFYDDAPAGEFRAAIYLDGDELLSATLDLTGETVTTVWAWLDGETPSLGLTTVSNPSFAPGNAGVRFLHAATDAPNVDIYLDCEDTDCTPAFADVAYGSDATMGAWAELPEGERSIAVYAAGTDLADTEAAPVLTADVTLTAGAAYLIVATTDGTDVLVSAFEEEVDADEESTNLVIVHAAFGVDAVDVLGEPAAQVETLSFNEITTDDEDLYFGTYEGMNVAVRAAGSDIDSEPIFSTGPLSLEGLNTVIVAGLAADESLTYFVVSDSFPALGEGEGAVRVIHAAPAVGAVTVNLPGESSEVCTPTAIDGFGLCAEGCTPYPRTGGGDYDCDDATDTCFPFSPRDDRPVAPLGACQADTGTGAAGASCTTVGRLGGDCADFAVCLSEEQTDTTGECLPLCEPFAADACGDFGTCSGVPPLVGQLNFSFCLPDAQPGAAYDPCTEQGLPCAEDGTICLALGQGARQLCYPICRQGFDDCDGFEDRSCVTGQLNPEVVPTFMGLCQ